MPPPECLEIKVTCECCGEAMKRGQLEEHINKECEKISVPCPFSSSGCDVRLSRQVNWGGEGSFLLVFSYFFSSQEMEDHVLSQVTSHMLV